MKSLPESIQAAAWETSEINCTMCNRCTDQHLFVRRCEGNSQASQQTMNCKSTVKNPCLHGVRLASAMLYSRVCSRCLQPTRFGAPCAPQQLKSDSAGNPKWVVMLPERANSGLRPPPLSRTSSPSTRAARRLHEGLDANPGTTTVASRSHSFCSM